MSITNRARGVVLAGLSLSLVLSGCGSDDDSDGDGDGDLMVVGSLSADASSSAPAQPVSAVRKPETSRTATGTERAGTTRG